MTWLRSQWRFLAWNWTFWPTLPWRSLWTPASGWPSFHYKPKGKALLCHKVGPPRWKKNIWSTFSFLNLFFFEACYMCLFWEKHVFFWERVWLSGISLPGSKVCDESYKLCHLAKLPTNRAAETDRFSGPQPCWWGKKFNRLNFTRAYDDWMEMRKAPRFLASAVFLHVVLKEIKIVMTRDWQTGFSMFVARTSTKSN